jgi:hypothetical protein
MEDKIILLLSGRRRRSKQASTHTHTHIIAQYVYSRHRVALFSKNFLRHCLLLVF